MPRNGSGQYSLPAGNPVASGALIEASWANTTLSDLASAMTDSLARSGEGGMTGALRLTDGTNSAPAVAFSNEVASGIYRAGTGDIRVAIAGVDAAYFTSIGLTLPSGKKVVTPTLEASSALTIRTNGADAVTVDSSGNLLVGTATNTNSRRMLVNGTGSGSTYLAVGDISQTANQTLLGIDPASTIGYVGTTSWGIGFLANGTEKMRLDASGNLGLGVTPSAWGSSGRAFETSGGSFYGFSTTSVNIANNAYFNGTSWIYKNTSPASNFRAVSGGFDWNVAPSGTAGNAISFTQAMTLAASGNLVIGMTSDSGGKVRIKGGTQPLVFDSTAASGELIGPEWRASDNSLRAFIKDTTESPSGGEFRIATNIGSSYIAFATGDNVERARITSGGDFLVGTTTVAGAGGITLFNNSGPGFSLVNDNNAASSGYVFESFRRSSVEIGSITQNGTTAVLFNTTSDARLKHNISPASDAGTAVDSINIVQFDWKSDGTHQPYGVLAQNLHNVAPYAVKEGDNGEDVINPWAVDYSKLVPMLIKEIQSLRARVAALEGQ
jgi:hypothetical protein